MSTRQSQSSWAQVKTVPTGYKAMSLISYNALTWATKHTGHVNAGQ